MTPHITSSKTLFRNTYRTAREHPRVTLGVAAASVATVAGVWAGVAAGSTPAVGAASAAGAMSHASVTHVSPHADAVADARTHGVEAAAKAKVVPAHRTVHVRPAPAHHAAARPAAVKHATAAVKHSAAVKHPAEISHAVAAAHAPAAAKHAAPAKAAPAKAAPAKAAPAKAAPAKAVPAQPTRPYEIYDSVTPSSIPSGREVATYATGNFAVPAAQVAGRHVLWIDTNGSDPHAAALDVEPGDCTPSQAATWAAAKLNANPHGVAIIYTMQSDWQAAQSAVGALPGWMHSHIRWWIADPTGVPHLVPGSNATQWYWGQSYDISTATPGF